MFLERQDKWDELDYYTFSGQSQCLYEAGQVTNKGKGKESAQTANRPRSEKSLRGEYELLSDSSPSRNEARRKFLKAIRSQVLPTLKEGPFKLYEDSFETLAGCLRGKYHLRKINEKNLYRFWSEFEVVAKENPTLLPLHDLIISWAKSFNLLYQTSGQYAGWLLDQTLHTLNHWHWHPWYRDNLVWEETSLSTMPQAQTTENPPFDFKYPAWDCFQLSRSAYNALIRGAFEYQLNEYMDSRDIGLQEEIVRELNIVKPRQKREGGSKRDWAKYHLDWFIHYQIEGMEFADISSLYATGPKSSDRPTHPAIWSAIRNVGLLLGLKPRPPKSSRRPRKLN